MTGQPAHDTPVIVTVQPNSASLDAVWWTADYARHRGLPLRIVSTSLDSSSIVDLVRIRFPDLVVRNMSTTKPLVDALVDESQHAHLIVVDHQPRNNALVTALSARARCPVLALPRGAEWNEPVRPVVVGVHGGERSPAVLAFAFAEAERLGTGVRVVRCAPGPVTGCTVTEAIAGVAAGHPDVPLRVEGSNCAPVHALAWHAHFGSMVVVGSRGKGRVLGALFGSISRGVLHQASGPVVVIGPYAIAAYQAHQAVSDLDTARS